MSFFAELRRRNVFRVAAAYIIVGWLIMQAGEVLAPALHLPEWVNSTLAFFLILGFPLALILAWAFELTPDGIKKEREVDRTQSITHVTGRKLNFTIIALMAAALAYFAWDKFGANPDSDVELAQIKPTKKSIAVIPFRNRSVNEENAEFFSDGVHDELLTNLSRIKELKVISRTSVMNYRDTTKNMKQIGEELDVANILEGGVQRAGNTVRINVQLIDAATDEHLWAEVYDRQLTAENIFAIQAEIAHAIAEALEATLSPREQELLATPPTANLEAYESLLIASQLSIRGNWQDLLDAQSYLKNAIELDPEFVQAYVLLASTYFHLISTGAVTLHEVNGPWGDAVQTALSLDENSASAQAVYAQFLWLNGLEGVDDAFEKARQLEPANADIMGMYAAYERKNFHIDRALQLYQSARELDPLSIPVLFGLARIYELRREVDKSLEFYARIRQIAPSSSTGIGPVSGVYMLTGNMIQSAIWLFKALAVDPDDSDLHNWTALAYIDFGDYTIARQWLTWTEQNQSINPMNLSGMAMLNIHEGNINASISYTRQALEDQMPDRWGSDSVHVRTLLIWALDKGQTGAALELLRQAHPELFEQNPIVNADNVLQAIDTAHLLQNENHNVEAAKLLQAAIAAYKKPYAVTEAWMTTGKAQALALLGEKEAALNELRHQVDEGSRLFWRWNTELNPNFESLRDDPEFQAIIEFLRADMTRQYTEVQAMEAAGEIPAPPGSETIENRH